MALSQADILSQTALCKNAIELELQELRTLRWSSEFFLALEPWLLDVYGMLRPRPCEYEQRAVLVQAFNMLAKDTFGADGGFPVVEAFGSFTMDLFTTGSDLDLSINFSNDYATKLHRVKKVAVLRKFTRFLYKVQGKGHISKILPVLKARVPVVKIIDSGTGIECDVSAENKDGVLRSSILAAVSLIDERFRLLSYLMKAWAKAHDINSSKDRTMNSLSIISFVAFHLQYTPRTVTRDPPILPPFSAVFKDGTDVSSVQKLVVGFKNFGRRNEESLAKLFVTLLTKLSAAESLWSEGLCASTFEGSWIKKEWKKGRIGIMSIEDFLDRSENFARSVGKDEMKKINDCIKGSLELLKGHMTGEIVEVVLKESLFGSPMLNVSNNFIGKPIGLKRPVPFCEPDFINPATANKTARYFEASPEQNHNFHLGPTNLPNPSIPRNPNASLQIDHVEGHKNPYEQPQLGYGPQYNPQPPFPPLRGHSHPSLPSGSLPSFNSSRVEDHLNSFEPFQSGNVPQSEYQARAPFPPPSASGSQHQWQPPSVPRPNHGIENFRPPIYPQSPSVPRPNYGIENFRLPVYPQSPSVPRPPVYPQSPSVPRPNYGMENFRPPVYPQSPSVPRSPVYPQSPSVPRPNYGIENFRPPVYPQLGFGPQYHP